MIQLLQGDCLDLLPQIPVGSVDMVLCDPPFGITKNRWDNKIPLDRLWGGIKRVCKPNAAMLFFSQMPFAAELVMSNPEIFKYEWIWEKHMVTGRLNCNYAPLKAHENILVFSQKAACYVKDPSKAMPYNPQMGSGKPYKSVSGRASSNYDTRWNKKRKTVNNGERYPKDILKFKHDKDNFHPTQKPVPLLEYLIKTYTTPGETVLDPTMGSGSTGVAAINAGRGFVGIELDPGYFEIAQRRIQAAQDAISREGIQGTH